MLYLFKCRDGLLQDTSTIPFLFFFAFKMHFILHRIPLFHLVPFNLNVFQFIIAEFLWIYALFLVLFLLWVLQGFRWRPASCKIFSSPLIHNMLKYSFVLFHWSYTVVNFSKNWSNKKWHTQTNLIPFLISFWKF